MPMQVLSNDEIEKIHEGSVKILETAGVLVDHPETLKLLEKNGAIVDYDSKNAKIPRSLIERCIKSIPTTFDLYDRDGNKAFTVGDGETLCASGHNAVFFIDHLSNERRTATVKDCEEFAVLSDVLSDIDIVGVPLAPQVENMKYNLCYAVKALFENTRKPLFFSTESYEVNHAIIELMKVVADSADIHKKPNAISQISSTSPLFWESGAVRALVDTCQQGVPITLLPEPMTGVSSPYSVAGLLLVCNAESLSGFVIGQCANPGAPMIYGNSWTTFDMKFCNAKISAPECHVLCVAGAQMARFYNIPCHTTAPNSDANTHDEQVAWEKSFSNLCAIFGCNHIAMNSGMFATGLTISFEQLVIDNELNGIIRRMQRGIRVDDETLGIDAILEVGQRGDFFVHPHTLELLYTDEFRYSSLVRAETYDSWSQKGAKDIVTFAAQQVSEILARGNQCPLPKQTVDKMQAILDALE